jgi:hypothetical protein
MTLLIKNKEGCELPRNFNDPRDKPYHPHHDPGEEQRPMHAQSFQE